MPRLTADGDLDIGDGTMIGPRKARTRVGGGGTVGGRAWVARITGPHPRDRLEREFCQISRDGRSGSGRSGFMEWVLPRTGVYEARDFAVSSNSSWSGFVLAIATGVTMASREDVKAWAGLTGEVAAIAEALAEGWQCGLAELTAASYSLAAPAGEPPPISA